MRKRQIDSSGFLFSNKALAALILPLMVEQLLAILVGLMDSIMTASVGESAVSGVSLVDSVMMLFMTIFSSLATGGAVVAGQYLGRKEPDNAKKSVNQLVWFVTLVSVVITVLVYLFRPFILNTLFGQIEPDVRHHADTYLLIVSASIPFISLYSAVASVFRAMGNSGVTMRVSILINIISITGNAILIYVFKCGTEGVAVPTLLSRIVGAVLITVLLFDKKHELHLSFDPKIYRFDKNMIRRILYIGVPNGLENSMFQLGKILVLSLVSTFGTYAITANAVANVFASFQVLPGTAMTLAATPVISKCVGANDYSQAKYYVKKLHIITYICMALLGLVIFAAIPLILFAYDLSDLTAATTQNLLLLHGICAIVIWPVAFVLPTMLRASGDVKFSMIVSVASMWICRIVMSYIFGKFLGFGVFGVWMAMILDWIVRSACFLFRYFSGKWKNRTVI